MKRATHFWRRLIVIATIALLVIPAGLAMAAKPASPPGQGGGGETTTPNNLSVPAIFVPNDGTYGLNCDGIADPPEGTPYLGSEWGYDDPDGYFYVQGVHTWQAACLEADADTVDATVVWGANLLGSEGEEVALKAGTPIRVEIALENTLDASMVGYTVNKLQEALSDKLSAYGITALGQTGGVTAIDFTTVNVFDLQAKFSLYNETTGEYVTRAEPNTTITAEINATGKVIYGFNWGIGGHGVKNLPTAGTYLLTFSAPNVNLTDQNGGANGEIVDADTATLTFTVSPNNSAGGGGNGSGHGRNR